MSMFGLRDISEIRSQLVCAFQLLQVEEPINTGHCEKNKERVLKKRFLYSGFWKKVPSFLGAHSFLNHKVFYLFMEFLIAMLWKTK